jgi:phosphohistidine phosphatase
VTPQGRHVIIQSVVVHVVLVGHNPGLENLVTLLTDRPIRLPTAALAVIELPAAPWAAVRASTGLLHAAGRPPAP